METTVWIVVKNEYGNVRYFGFNYYSGQPCFTAELKDAVIYFDRYWADQNAKQFDGTVRECKLVIISEIPR